jgi:SGNH domain (fused to AT3 domains)
VVAVGVKADAQRKLAEPFFARLAAAEVAGSQGDGGAVCDPQHSTAGVEYCTYGDRNATTTVMLVGDSHATQWIPPFDRAATALGVRLVVSSRGSCPSVPVDIARSATQQVPTSLCVDTRRDTQSLIDELRPAAVVLANKGYVDSIVGDDGVPDRADQLTIWTDALVSRVDELEHSGHRVGLILDDPTLSFDPNICIARKQSVDACVPSRSDALATTGPFNDAQRDAVASRGVPTLDAVAGLCDEQQCALEHDGALVYRDKDHLTTYYTLSQIPAVTAFLHELLAPRP